MSKKNRRAPRKVTPRQETSVPGAAQTLAATEAPAASPWRTPTAKVDLNQEYRYVFADLRKMGVLAATMFALLFVLALVLK